MIKSIRHFTVLTTAMMIAMSVSCSAAKKIVAVIPIEDSYGYISKYVNMNLAEAMTKELTIVLYQSGQYNIIERNRLDTALEEIDLQMTGAIDSSKAVQTGKLLGAQYVILGKITLAKTTSSGGLKSLINIKSIMQPFQAKIVLNYKFIDVQTGVVKYMGNVKGVGYADSDRDTSLYNACQNAAQKVLQKLAIDVRAKVVDVEENKIYIDVGNNGGLKKGDFLSIVRKTSVIEINGEIVGIKEIAIGTAKIVEVNDKYSICKVTSQSKNETVQKGDIVKKDR